MMNPRTFFIGVILAVLALTVPVMATTVAFSPHTNNSPYRSQENSAWSALRGGVGDGLYYEPLDLAASLNSGTTSNNYTTLYRAALIYNTASLPDACTITGATLVIRGSGSYAQLGAFSASITGFTPGTSGTITASDYDNFADVKYATDIPQTSLVENGNNTFTFTAAGIANISKSSYTNLMIRPSVDVENNIGGFVWGSDYWNAMTFDSGQVLRPQLIITYTEGSLAPVSAFSADHTLGYSPLTVQFTDASTNTPTNWDWYWYVNETKGSDLQNPSKIFTTGLYNVRLYTSNVNGGDWENKTGYINATEGFDPWEGYVPESITGNAPLTIDFTDISYNSPTNWNWSFRNVTGDNITVWFSQVQNPTYTFNYGGNYSIQLNASNSFGYNLTPPLAFVNLTSYTSPVAAFSANKTFGASPLTVNFTDSSTNSPNDWDWYWYANETKSSNEQNPVTTLTAGTYNVRLWAANAYGGDWENKTGYIVVGNKPVSSFTKNTTSGNAPLGVGFTDTSTYSPTSWNWSFNNVTGNDTVVWWSTAQNPSIRLGVGNWSFVLNTTNSYGSNLSTTTHFVNVSSQLYPPVTAFSANVTGGTTPLAVGFTDSSTNTPTNWDWYFGNGTKFSDDQNPIVTLTTGVYTINLYASNADGGDWENKTNYIVVNDVITPPPIAAFGCVPLSGARPLSVICTDSSSGSPTSWIWMWGDGNYSYTQNPSHSYGYIGVFSVNLRATNAGGSDWENKTGYISVTSGVVAPVAAFSANVTSGITPLSVGFTDSSLNTPTNWDWYWSNDETKDSDAQNPTVQLTTGVYNIRLYVSNIAGGDWENKTGYINVTSGIVTPVANFVGVPTSGIWPLNVQFTDTSTNTPTSWSWTFGDGNTSILQNPLHTYAFYDIFTVSLNSTNAAGSDIETKVNYITVDSGETIPVANFVGVPTLGVVPTNVQFTDTSANTPTAWNWSFGDGNFSESENPLHAYTFAGTFTVALNASNSKGGNIKTRTNYITIVGTSSGGTTGFIMEVNNGTLGMFIPIDADHTVFRGDTVRFTDNSTGAPTAWAWSFGDGFESTVQNPDHTYTYGKQPIIMHDGYKNLEVELVTPEGGTYTDTIRFTSPLAPIVTQSTNITLMNESLAQNYTEALTGNRSAPPGWSGFDWARGIQNTALAYAGVLGWTIFLILVFAIPFIMNWIITKDFVVAGIIGGFIGVYIIVRLPGQMQLIAVAFIVMSVVAVVYSLIKERV